MNLEPEANDIVCVVGEANAINYSIAISLKRVANHLSNMDQRQRCAELPEIDLDSLKAQFAESAPQ